MAHLLNKLASQVDFQQTKKLKVIKVWLVGTFHENLLLKQCTIVAVEVNSTIQLHTVMTCAKKVYMTGWASFRNHSAEVGSTSCARLMKRQVRQLWHSKMKHEDIDPNRLSLLKLPRYFTTTYFGLVFLEKWIALSALLSVPTQSPFFLSFIHPNSIQSLNLELPTLTLPELGPEDWVLQHNDTKVAKVHGAG